jgi:hypothetical protein
MPATGTDLDINAWVESNPNVIYSVDALDKTTVLYKYTLVVYHIFLT